MGVRIAIQESIAVLKDDETMWLAIDTEWGDEERAMHCGPSIVQLALIDRVWVVDTAVIHIWQRTFFRWLFKQRRVTFFGFSFGQDMVRLSVLLGKDEKKPDFKLVDLQKLAMVDCNKSI